VTTTATPFTYEPTASPSLEPITAMEVTISSSVGLSGNVSCADFDKDAQGAFRDSILLVQNDGFIGVTYVTGLSCVQNAEAASLRMLLFLLQTTSSITIEFDIVLLYSSSLSMSATTVFEQYSAAFTSFIEDGDFFESLQANLVEASNSSSFQPGKNIIASFSNYTTAIIDVPGDFFFFFPTSSPTAFPTAYSDTADPAVLKSWLIIVIAVVGFLVVVGGIAYYYRSSKRNKRHSLVVVPIDESKKGSADMMALYPTDNFRGVPLSP
jgi:hypothetical protein